MDIQSLLLNLISDEGREREYVKKGTVVVERGNYYEYVNVCREEEEDEQCLKRGIGEYKNSFYR